MEFYSVSTLGYIVNELLIASRGRMFATNFKMDQLRQQSCGCAD
jgi:hypothetical protein